MSLEDLRPLEEVEEDSRRGATMQARQFRDLSRDLHRIELFESRRAILFRLSMRIPKERIHQREESGARNPILLTNENPEPQRPAKPYTCSAN